MGITVPAAPPSPAARRRRLLAFGLSAFGYVLMATVFVWAVSVDDIGWDIKTVYQPAGEALRSGAPVYAYGFQPFLYSPPAAVLIAVLTLLPGAILFVLVAAANAAALRYVAGSWLRVGYLLWLPPVWFELLNGNVNLLMAGAILAAIRSGAAALPTLLSFAKFSPILAVEPGRWRRVLVWGLIGVAVTLPWWHLWPEWVGQIQQRLGEPVGPLVPIPLLVRLPAGLALVATRTRLGRALGAAVATPAFYWSSSVLLLPALVLWLELPERNPFRRAARPA